MALGAMTLILLSLTIGRIQASGWPFSILFAQGIGGTGFQIETSVTPEAIKPGSQISLELTLTNLHQRLSSPEIRILIPENLSLAMDDVPPRTSYNVQAGELHWQIMQLRPGGQALIGIALTANVADIKSPQQSIGIKVTDGDFEQTADVPVWIGVEPDAHINLGQATASVGETVQLEAAVVGPEPIHQLWDLGDGRVIDAQNPEIIYPAPGVYTVTLRVSNPVGVASAETYITVKSQPKALFSLADQTVEVGRFAEFVNLSGGQSPLHFSWEFGDGEVSQEKSPIHTYVEPGMYEVQLTVENEFGSSQAAGRISVGLPPNADIQFTSESSAGTLFHAQAVTDGSVLNFNWDMGDGNFYEGTNVTHVYWSAGDYLVTLIAANDYGATTVSKPVTILPGTLFLYMPYITTYAAVSDELPIVVSSQDNAVDTEPIEELPVLDLPLLNESEQLLAYINEARRINNVPVLNLDSALNAAAQLHTDDMAINHFTSHEGSDGSSPAYRIRESGYMGGYTGEATAWGMQTAVEPVRFWLSSPAHRVILLNPAATEVGVGYTRNFEAPNVWYWTAEFASMSLPVVEVEPLPTSAEPIPDSAIELLGPPRGTEVILLPDNYLIFTWSWPEPLEENQRFSIYLKGASRTYQVGSIRENQPENQYSYKIPAIDVPVTLGQMEWQVRLETSPNSKLIYQSEFRPIIFRAVGDD